MILHLTEDQIIDLETLLNNYNSIFETIPIQKTIDLPSEWAEAHIVLTRDVSEMDGKFSYDPTPFWREVINNLHPSNPVKIMFIMKSGQIGFTQCVLTPAICWKIAQNPSNMMVTAGNDQLSKEFVSTRLDPAIKSAGIQHLIRTNVIKKKNAKTGDTDNHKQFAGGNLYACSVGAIDTIGKQKSINTLFCDDWSASKIADKKQGNLFDILQQRTNTSAFTMKQVFSSTAESTPDPTHIGYLKGDQRKYFMTCPVCGEMINFEFSVTIEGERCGLVFEKDENGKLIKESVKYRCQNCWDHFPESEKFKMMENGRWIPTAKPIRDDWYSYHISALYGAPNMMSWATIAERWLEIFESGKCDTAKLKAFKNLILGEVYEEEVKKTSAQAIMQNMPGYQVRTVPQETANAVGCGDIMFLTAGFDFGGVEMDARVDYEIIGWTENGQSFSIDQGSIGTYSWNKSQNQKERIKWNYTLNSEYSVFREIVRLVGPETYYNFDNGKDSMNVSYSCLDTGYLPDTIKNFISLGYISASPVIGRVSAQAFNENVDRPRYKFSTSEHNLVLVETDIIKNDHARNLEKLMPESGEPQPGTMFFPDPFEGKYRSNMFFKQLESEEKLPVLDNNGNVKAYEWHKKQGYQNHFLDTRVYADCAKYIYMDHILDTKRVTIDQYAQIYRSSKK